MYFPVIVIVKNVLQYGLYISSLNFECNSMQYFLLTHIFITVFIDNQEWSIVSDDYLHQDQQYYLQTSLEK